MSEIDVDVQGYVFLGALLGLAAIALFCLAAAAHWRRLRIRWLIQTMAVGLACVVAVLLTS